MGPPNPPPPPTPSSAAATALNLLLTEDRLLSQLNLTTYKSSSNHGKEMPSPSLSVNANEDAAFSYAAALMHDQSSGWMSSPDQVQQRATEALAEVDRKLALVEGLAERVARDNPEAVAGPLLRLHGFTVENSNNNNEKKKAEEEKGDENGSLLTAANNISTLVATREKCDRLQRQGEMLEGVGRRVESSLQRGYAKMESTTKRLSRILQLSSTLKMAMRLRFEAKKIQGCGIDFDGIASGAGGNVGGGMDVDLRDLTRAASSVAAMEALLADPDLYGEDNGGAGDDNELIEVVERMRPEVETAALAVRRAAANLLAEQQQPTSSGINSSLSSSSKLGATLQVYFHLGELPQAAWSAVSQSLATAEKAASQFFNPASLQRLQEAAENEAKLAIESGNVSSNQTPASKKHGEEAFLQRTITKKLQIERSEAASRWANAVCDAASRVSNLQRVLTRKSDPVSRVNFLTVVSEAPIPDKFTQAAESCGLNDENKKNFSILNLFWHQMCIGLGARIQRLVKYNNGKLEGEVAALYPFVRSAALDMLGELTDVMHLGYLGKGEEGDGGGGIMGGSAVLEEECDILLSTGIGGENGSVVPGADLWTRDVEPSQSNSDSQGKPSIRNSSGRRVGNDSGGIFGSEWKTLQGHDIVGMYPLQCSFMDASNERLCAPLQYLFPEEVTVEEGGVTLQILPTLPSKYDLAKVENCIREELTTADPRQGGGEFGMTVMICENIVDMVESFCAVASGATSGVGDEENDGDAGNGYLHQNDGTATEALNHDLKLAGLMNALSEALRNAPEQTFLAPYRPTQSPQHDEAARICALSLLPAIKLIQNLVKKSILSPLSHALNERVSAALANMHLGTYLEDNNADPMENAGGGFVQTHLTKLYESIASHHLAKLPTEYGSIVAETVATYSIYAFVSNVSLVRPLGEMGRLRITQDLADFELALEQLVFAGNGGDTGRNPGGGGKHSNAMASKGTLSGMEGYAELRALRQMLFWNGFEDATAPPEDITKKLLLEAWLADVRPSTVFHYLFSFAPNTLTSPHHSKRILAEEYVREYLVRTLDGSVEDGETSAWMTTMACCDAYQQRETVGIISGGDVGDRRVAAVLMGLGPELLRRRGH